MRSFAANILGDIGNSHVRKITAFWYWSQCVTQKYTVTRWFQLPQLSARVLRYLIRPAVANNFAFQRLPPNARSDDYKQTLQKQFSDITSVWAMWPIGEMFFEFAENAHIVKRLILPNPERAHVKYYFGMMKKNDAIRLIKMTTLKAKHLGVDVRWADSFVFNSFTLANHEQITGWAHVESVFDSALIGDDARVGYLLFKDRTPTQFNTLVNLFLQEWQDAKEPTLRASDVEALD